MFADDQNAATQIDFKEWKDRSLSQRVKEAFAFAWEKLL